MQLTCAVPLRRLAIGQCFLFEPHDGALWVGILDRLGVGYAQVTVIAGKGKLHKFTDHKGKEHEFEDSGFREFEWSPGTLVRPLVEDDEMSDEQAGNSFVQESEQAPSRKEIEEKKAKLKAKAATKAAKTPVGTKSKDAKPIKKVMKEKAPKAQNPCKCGCGGTTGGNFVPGHDARYYGWLKKIVAGTFEPNDDFKKLPKAEQKRLQDVKVAKAELASHGKK